MGFHRTVMRVLLVACAVSLAADAVHAAAIFWDGGGDGASWSDPNNWSTNTLPGPSDDVTISVAGNIAVAHSTGTTSINSLQCDEALVLSGGSLSIAAGSQIAVFTLSGGTLSGTGAVTVSGSMNWTGGTMSGSGTTVIASDALLSLQGTEYKQLSGRTLRNLGTAVWTQGPITIYSGGKFVNEVGGVFDARVDNIVYMFGGQGTFDNRGELRKSAGAGTTWIGHSSTSGPGRFSNSGTVQVQSGTVSIWLTGANSSSGSFDAGPGTELSLNTTSTGTHTLEAGS